ncbi:MAG: tetratricopeptide repeat protein, partial [Deltaproteobacteria bacterium]
MTIALGAAVLVPATAFATAAGAGDSAAGAALVSSRRIELRDLYFGEALYLIGHYGIEEPALDALQYHIKTAEFSVGAFELNYRMNHRAGRAVKAVLEADVEDAVRNAAAYRLARIQFQKDHPADALDALDHIRGEVPENIRDDVQLLRANILLAMGRPADAIGVLRPLQGSETVAGYSAYNLGIALLQNGHAKEAAEQLEASGKLAASDPAALAIRDK